jgi:hypothetical protein
MDRVKYIETGQEDSYESKRRIEGTSALAKGRRKSQRKTNKRKTNKRKTNKRSTHRRR